jgi:hypothetical protein
MPMGTTSERDVSHKSISAPLPATRIPLPRIHLLHQASKRKKPSSVSDPELTRRVTVVSKRVGFFPVAKHLP